jgi:hypothetical protein
MSVKSPYTVTCESVLPPILLDSEDSRCKFQHNARLRDVLLLTAVVKILYSMLAMYSVLRCIVVQLT